MATKRERRCSASSISRTISARSVPSPTARTRIDSGAPRLIVPANTRSPGVTRCGTVSPVISAGVELTHAAAHRAVRADALAGRDQDLLAGLELLGPHAAGGAVGQEQG